MPKKATEVFTAVIPVTFTFVEGTSYTKVMQFVKDAKVDIKAMFDGRCEAGVGKVILQKITKY